jgi:FADH2 O2-dependent halogenase
LRIAVVGSGFAGSLLARILAVQKHDVVLLERGAHPRFAIGESSTPLANLTLERLARRYGLDDCYDLAAHGRWMARFPELRRGLKRGFTFYRHHAGRPFASNGHGPPPAERLLVAASPTDHVADNPWLRADVDDHFVRAAVAAGVDYRDRVEVTDAMLDSLRVDFVVDASGPGGFMARRLGISSALHRMHTHAGLLFSHFDGARLMTDAVPGLPPGPYPDDWAAVHHIIDEGWMYSLRFDHGVTSAGFVLKQRLSGSPDQMWQHLLQRYPTIGALFGDAKPPMPLTYKPRFDIRPHAPTGDEWARCRMPHCFVDPLFSTGSLSLHAVERLAPCFESGGPLIQDSRRYEALLGAEADQDRRWWRVTLRWRASIARAHAMIYFAAVSFAEIRQRVAQLDAEANAWSGFLGVGDPRLGALPRASLRRLRHTRSPAERREFVQWVSKAIASRNVCGFANRAAHNLYGVDVDLLVQRHHVLGLSRDALVSALPALRGFA